MVIIIYVKLSEIGMRWHCFQSQMSGYLVLLKSHTFDRITVYWKMEIEALSVHFISIQVEATRRIQ